MRILRHEFENSYDRVTFGYGYQTNETTCFLQMSNKKTVQNRAKSNKKRTCGGNGSSRPDGHDIKGFLTFT